MLARQAVPEEPATTPHYLGHRERLRERFHSAGADALSDYELLELALFPALPRRDTKPLAKALIETLRLVRRGRARAGRRGCARSTASAKRCDRPAQGDRGGGAAASPRARSTAATRCRPGTTVIDYCRAGDGLRRQASSSACSSSTRRNQLIADEVQQTGTVDHTPVYPREVIKRALELSATAIILVHNHPSRRSHALAAPTSR